MKNKYSIIKKLLVTLSPILAIFLLSSCAILTNQNYVSYRVVDNSVIVNSKLGEVKYTALSTGSIEVVYLEEEGKQLPSFSKQNSLNSLPLQVNEFKKEIKLVNGDLSAIINKQDMTTSFYRGEQLLTTQMSYFNNEEKLGFDFKLEQNEKVLGGGQRVLGMDRRGHRMPLYNRAHYGYTTESNQMNYSLPFIMSSKKYSILFDNSASGFLDIAKTKANTLTFEALGGQSSYIIFAAKSYPKLINQYVDVTGKQPMPSRWALGNIASRFGYRSEQEVRNTIDKYIEEDMPVDSIILDLYWFGNDIKGFMGNLDWDRETFPTPVKMISDLKEKGIKTILITEPFILSTSDKWQEAVDAQILAKDDNGLAKRFDFYFGNTGLIDVFDEKAQDWFGNVYKQLIDQGVAGVWGDLGEPEVHPDDTIHFLSDINRTARGDEIHNAYGHQWAKMVYQKQLKAQPDVRPFILMRSGFAGSQRYGMLPWTGDVSRSWDGLKPQVELSLQMSLGGLAYTHSDLGGFAGGEVFDQEMYIRWLQYGVFQPIYRPHAQDNIAAEPVFHDQQTIDIIRKYIKLRYQLLPYNYTLAYQNSTTGMPLMRPIFFEDENEPKLIDITDTYLWGNAFLVSPIVEPNLTTQKISLPAGVWFDYWKNTRYQGGKDIQLSVDLESLPVLVRAGSFIPMIDEINNTENYSSKNLTLHYYADESVAQSKSEMYEDDGKSFDSIKSGAFELINFSSMHNQKQLSISLERQGKGYKGMPSERKLTLVVHNWKKRIVSISFAGKLLDSTQYKLNLQNNTVEISVAWDHQPAQLIIQ